ncbi:MAG: DNA methyltransferase, partial [Candidatus Brocadiia bacterium]
KKGTDSPAQIEAFEDTWHWGEEAEKAYYDVSQGKHRKHDVAYMILALRTYLGENDMMAYLVNMAARLVELHRVLKPTGSLYLHCDPTASHYLKVVLDGVFGINGFRTEISWKRQSAHCDAKQGRKQYGNIRDVILFYTKTDKWTWNWLYTPYSEEYIRKFYRHVEPETGRRFQLGDLTAPGGAAPEKGNPHYEYLGVTRYWRFSKESMEELHRQGRIVQSNPGSVPRHKRYLDEMPGIPLQNDWSDILMAMRGEALGYQTQKPLALLERIIRASSNEGDVVLDPFCGCGTALHAAESLKRQWIGIDVTHLAISLIERRLREAFPGISFEVHGTPKDTDGARNLMERGKAYQFQWWALSLVDAMPFKDKKKGADSGIDGVLFVSSVGRPAEKVIVSVKGGGNVSVSMIRDLKGVMEREKAPAGLLITLAPPTEPMRVEAMASGFWEVDFKKYLRVQILTIEELLAGKRPDLPPSDPRAWKKAREEGGELLRTAQKE